MRIEKDYEELLRLFNNHKVRYCVVGAFAVAFHARGRYTKDIDILVESSAGNAARILPALEEFGFGSLQLDKNDFTRPGRIIQLGYEPLRVDLATSIEGVDFERVWRNKKTGRYGRQKAYFIGINELLRNKKISNRPQDKADLEILKSAKVKRPRRK